VLILLCCSSALATGYHVGPGQSYANIGDVPWESLAAGDTVYIHARPAPYYEKWVLNRVGTALAPITVRGVPDVNGVLPVIHGEGATTRLQLDFWSEDRGILKIGGSSVPDIETPAYIVVENLHFRRARGAFTGDSGAAGIYNKNASGIFVESGDHITIRNCIVEDNGNGIFVAAATSNMSIEGNHIYGNGNVGSVYEHNTYTEARGILYQYNRFGPLCSGCGGNNLKDRSSGTVIRFNWIEAGNRQMDLVDAEGSVDLVNDPGYLQTFVYGNLLIEPDDGNSQIVHFGGDSGTTAEYRGTLYFWNNTVVSTRAGNTTLLRLSTNAQTAEVWNNIVYVSAAGNRLALSDGSGTLRYGGNLFKPGYANSFSTLTGSVTNLGGNLTAAAPGFVNEAGQDFTLTAASAARNAVAATPAAMGAYPVDYEYLKHQAGTTRLADGPPDIGAYEYHQPSRTLTVTVAGSGSGNVTSDLQHSGISCPGSCQACYAYGSSVTLTPYPAATSVFIGWGGACGSSPCAPAMDADRSVTATFDLARVRNKSTGSNYATLGAALTGAGAGNELLLQGLLYTGSVSLNSSLLLNGGWDAVFAARSGPPATLNDGLTVAAGDAQLENVTVMGGLTVTGGSLRVRDVMVQ
jgi:parallel beta-helix repeat protein